jgi:hypothetical protein
LLLKLLFQFIQAGLLGADEVAQFLNRVLWLLGDNGGKARQPDHQEPDKKGDSSGTKEPALAPLAHRQG